MKKLLQSIINNDIKSYHNVFCIQWHVTSLCTENCKHCYLTNKGIKNNVFNLENSKNIIDEIYKISLQKKLIPYIAFTGGDPLLFNDLFELIKYARSKNINVSIKGNPYLLNDNIIADLKDLNIQNYHLSIDGLKETHDYIRSEGSFDITIQALKKLKDAGIETLVKYTVSTLNYKEMNKIVNYLAEIGVDYFDFARFCPNSRDNYKYTFTSKEYRQFLLDVLKNYQSLKIKGFRLKLLFRDHLWIPLLYELGIIEDNLINRLDSNKIICGCSMGNNNCFAISYNGDLLPCSKIPKYSLGNILKNDINTLINTEKLKKLSRIQAYEGCMKCNLVGLCRGCPAINNSLSKDVFLKDPQCWIGDI